MKSHINFDYRYNTLLKVCLYGSYSAAGKELRLTPSAVKSQIHNLEEELGMPLFRYNGKSLTPTPECELVTEYVSKINSLCRKLDEELGSAQDSLHRLSVGITPSIESNALSRMLDSYHSENENIPLTVLTDSADSLREKLLSYVIDIAVADGEIAGANFNSFILDTDSIVAVVSPESSYASAGVIHLEDLKKEKLILRPVGTGTRNIFESKLRSMNISSSSFRIMLEIDSIETIKRLCAEGFGISLLSKKACEKEVSNGILCTVPVTELNMVRNINVYYRKDFCNHAILNKIKELY